MALPPGITPPSPGVGVGTAPGQPPFGSSPMQMPTPDRGSQAAALAEVSSAVKLLEKALPSLGASSPTGKDVMGCIQKLAKHVPPGSIDKGVESNSLQSLMMQGKQENPMLNVLRAMGQGGQAGAPPGAPPAPPPGASPPPEQG